MQPAVKRLSLSLLAVATFVAALAAPLRAETPPLSAEDHAWAKFDIGAWKKVRIVTETLDDAGAVCSTSTTDTSTILEGVGVKDYQLKIDVTVEVAGRKFDTESQHVTRGLFGEAEGQTSVFKNSSNTRITIEGKEIPCEVYTVEVRDDAKKRTAKIYYAPNFHPPVLRKELTTTDPQGKTVLEETIESVVAVDMPSKVLSDIHSTWQVKSVRTHPKGKSITLLVYADQVPGGVVSHSSKELDAAGKVIRRSTLEVVDYGVESDRHLLRFLPFKQRGKEARRR